MDQRPVHHAFARYPLELRDGAQRPDWLHRVRRALHNATMESFWDQAVRSPDQLRQRTVLALSEPFVISAANSPLEIQEDTHASYLDMLARNAFGNFRALLEQVFTRPAMGVYLSHLKNEKEDAATGRIPDENYAREVM